MPTPLQVSRDILASGVARVRSGLEEWERRAKVAGPEIQVQPFDAQNVSTPAALIKLGTSIAAARRKQANFDEARRMLADERAVAQQKAALEGDKTRAEIAKLRAEAGYEERRMPTVADPNVLTFDVGKYKRGTPREDVRIALSSEAADRARAAAGTPEKPKLGDLNVLADNFRQEKDVQNYTVVRDNFKRIEDSSKLESGQGDLAVIFSFMRVLDPESVVRETEFKNAAQAVGRLQQMANIPKQWIQGDRLTPEGRAGFRRAAKEIHDTQRRTYDTKAKIYERQAKAYGVDPSLIIPDYGDDSADVEWIMDANGNMVQQP